MVALPHIPDSEIVSSGTPVSPVAGELPVGVPSVSDVVGSAVASVVEAGGSEAEVEEAAAEVEDAEGSGADVEEAEGAEEEEGSAEEEAGGAEADVE